MNGKSRIIHREPLATVLGSIGFNLTQFEVNPGLATTFPWLSASAEGYEAYVVNSISAEFVTSSATTQTGRIVIAPDYDSADAPPTSVVQLEQMMDAYRGPAWQNGRCVLQPNGLGILTNKRYTRSGALSPNEDIKTYDIAKLNVATSGQIADNTEIGELWMLYDITLCVPQPISPPEIFLAGALINDDGSGGNTTHLLGTDAVAAGNISLTVALNVINVEGLVEGKRYRIIYRCNAAVVTGPPVLTVQAELSGGSSVTLLSTLNGTTTDGYYVGSFVAALPGGHITMSNVTVLTTPALLVFEIEGMVDNADLS